MIKRLIKPGESRIDYLKAALRYCRKVFNQLCETPEYNHCHVSFPACKALSLTEERFSDLGTFGIEGFCWNTFSGFTYLNTGETYELTLCFRSDYQRFSIDSYGGFVERNPKLVDSERGC